MDSDSNTPPAIPPRETVTRPQSAQSKRLDDVVRVLIAGGNLHTSGENALRELIDEPTDDEAAKIELEQKRAAGELEAA